MSLQDTKLRHMERPDSRCALTPQRPQLCGRLQRNCEAASCQTGFTSRRAVPGLPATLVHQPVHSCRMQLMRLLRLGPWPSHVAEYASVSLRSRSVPASSVSASTRKPPHNIVTISASTDVATNDHAAVTAQATACTAACVDSTDSAWLPPNVACAATAANMLPHVPATPCSANAFVTSSYLSKGLSACTLHLHADSASCKRASKAQREWHRTFS